MASVNGNECGWFIDKDTILRTRCPNYDFGHDNEYLCFLRDAVNDLKDAGALSYLSVIEGTWLEHIDNAACVLLSSEICDPNCELVAECEINGERLFIWKDQIWIWAVVESIGGGQPDALPAYWNLGKNKIMAVLCKIGSFETDE